MKKLIFFICLMLFTVFAVTAMADQQAEPKKVHLFNHDDHNKILEDESCNICHQKTDKQLRPEKESCAQCHDNEFISNVVLPPLKTHKDSFYIKDHKKFVNVKQFDCGTCHEQQHCADCHKGTFQNEVGRGIYSKQNPHGAEFIVGHPVQAKKYSKTCQSCHEVKFCSDCHNSFSAQTLQGESHRKSWSNLLTSPTGIQHSQFSTLSCQTCHTDSLTPTHEWGKAHAREARRNLASCQSCHSSGDTCMKCHSAKTGLMVNPHPDNWNKVSKNLKDASNNKTCRKCHN